MPRAKYIYTFNIYVPNGVSYNNVAFLNMVRFSTNLGIL